MTPMQNTKRWIGDRGVEFLNAFATTPVCCPSRSSILTGLYQSAHRVYNNSVSGGCNSKEWQDIYERRTIATALHTSGYRTFYAGKYLNQYGTGHGQSKRVPPGWDWWIGLVGNSVYYNYTLVINGSTVQYGDEPQDYLTDVVKGWGLEFLRHQRREKPFFMVLAPPAPHEPFTPAPKYDGVFKGLKAPRTPNFNDGSADKHWLLRLGPSHLPEDVIKEVDTAFSSRWETLLSVDEMVDSVANLLQQMNLLENTYLMYTSDHGFHLGQFGQALDKRQPYESDIRIPFMLSGPDLPANQAILQPVLTIDIAPTLYDIAQVKNAPHSNGTSIFRRMSKRRKSFGRTFNIEYHGEGGNGEPCYLDNNVKLCSQQNGCKCFDARNNTYTCQRHMSSRKNTLDCQFKDDENFCESYDMKNDPYQLNNLAKRKKICRRRNRYR